MPSRLSEYWFEMEEQATTTSVGVFFGQLGMAVGLGASVVVDLRAEDDSDLNFDMLAYSVGFQLIISAVGVVMVFYFVPQNRSRVPVKSSNSHLGLEATQSLSPSKCTNMNP